MPPIHVRPLLFADVREWIGFLPRPGTYEHPSYGEINLSPQRIANIVANFNAGTYGQDLPINAEHDMASSGAVGWIDAMRIGDDGSIEVKPRWNDRGQALLDGDRFRYVSAEWFDNWQHPTTNEWHADIASGMAICTHPYFKTDVLRPLAASEEAAMALQHEQKQPIRWTEEDAPLPKNDPKDQPSDEPTDTPSPEPVIVPEPDPQPEEAPMPDTTDVNEEQEAVAAEPVAVTLTEQTVQEFHAMRKELSEKNRQLAEAQVALSVATKQRRVKEFTDEVRGHSDGNDTAWIGDIEEHVQFLMDLSEKFGEQSPQIEKHIRRERAHAAQMKQSNLFKEIGTGRGGDTLTAQDQIELIAKRLREVDPHLTKEQAYSKALSENPGLYEQSLS